MSFWKLLLAYLLHRFLYIWNNQIVVVCEDTVKRGPPFTVLSEHKQTNTLLSWYWAALHFWWRVFWYSGQRCKSRHYTETMRFTDYFKQQTFGCRWKCSIYCSEKKLSTQDEVEPIWLKPQCGLPLMSDPAKWWRKQILYGFLLLSNELTAGSCCQADSLICHSSWGLTRATSGPGKQTSRSNRRVNQCPPQRWRSGQRGCVDIRLQKTARPG